MSILSVGRKRKDRKLNLKSMNFPNEISTSLDKLEYNEDDDWANYPKGVAWVLEKEGFRLNGADIIFEGNIPLKAGLSSSAAIEVVSMITLLTLSSKEIPNEDIIKLTKKAENEFVGVNCGIMDQFIVTLGKKAHALFLDCKTLDYKFIPINWENSILIVGNTKVKRGLAKSEYNERVYECREGAEILKKIINKEEIECLSDIKKNEFYKYKEELLSPIDKRCEHVILENDRVRKALEYLQKGDIKGLGNLLNNSHCSLRDLYEVSCRELEIMREEALKIEGVWGARMTGAGFGGCIIILAKKENKKDIINQVGEKYEREVGIEPEFHICEIVDGAHEI